MLLPPPCCRVWQLKLLQPDQSNSKKVRDSPQAVGVRVSMLILDCCGLNSKTPFPLECWREVGCNGRPGTAIGPLIGNASRFPFWPELEVGVPGLPLLAPLKK